MNKRVLLIGQAAAAANRARELQAAGVPTYAASEDGRVIDAIAADAIDVAIIDNVEDARGLPLIRQIRQLPAVGVIVLAERGQVVDRIVGLELGADDYVTGPIESRELLARVGSVLRRLESRQPATESPAESIVYAFAGWHFAPAAFTLRPPGRPALLLRASEVKVLQFLVAGAGRFWSADQISAALAGRGSTITPTTIKARICRLRATFGDDARLPRFIGTRRLEGYSFLLPVQAIGGADARRGYTRAPTQSGTNAQG